MFTFVAIINLLKTNNYEEITHTIHDLVGFAVVSSCGDSKPGDLPASQNASATKSINIVAAAGNTTTTETVFTKADFAALEKYAKWVTSGEVLTTSEIAISEIT